MSNEVIDRKIAVILVADVVGYSKHMEKDEDVTLKSYAECEKILKSLLDKRQGSIFNTAGDSILAEFSSAVNAVECAVEFQNKIIERNQSEKTTTKLEYRIGINMGDVVSREGNLLGDGVNIAARLEALCQPNSVCIAKSVYDLVVLKTKMTFCDLGIQNVKQNSFHAYDVLLDPSQKRKIKKNQKKSSATAILLGISVLGIALSSIIYFGIFYNEQKDLSISDKQHVKSDIGNVLIKPFKFLSNRDDLSYIASGFTNHLGTTLSQHPQLNVVSGATANFIDKNEINDSEVRGKYNVDYVVEATIQVSGEILRISTKISDLVAEKVVASEVYELTEDQVFEFQDKVADLALQKMSTMDHSIASKNRISQNPIIYKKHLLAQANMVSWTPDGHFKALQLVDEILAVEPNNMGIKMMLGWLLQQKFYLGLSDDVESDLTKSLGLAEEKLRYSNAESIDALALASSNEGLLEKYSAACARLQNMNEILGEKKSKASAHEYAMTAWINQNCESYELALATYEKLFKVSPHYPAWVRYYYVYTLLALNRFDRAEKFIMENKDLKYSYYGTNEVFRLCLVYIAHKKNEFKRAKTYYNEYEAMPNSLSLGYLKTDFAAARSKTFFSDFSEVLTTYGML